MLPLRYPGICVLVRWGRGGKPLWTRRGFGHDRRSARRVLQATIVEAHGRPGAYVTQDRVMWRANSIDTEHFRTVAKYSEASPGIFAPRLRV